MDETKTDGSEVLMLDCPNCGDITPHKILKKVEYKKSIKLTVRCLQCNNVHNIEKKLKLKDINIIISRYAHSEKKTKQFPTEEVLSVGDVINIDNEDLEITSIETTKRVNTSKVEDIKTIWAKSLSIPKKVGISINDRGKTYSIDVLVPNDYVFDNEKIYRIGKLFFKIRMIKTEKGTFKREVAKKIKRVYGDITRPTKKYEDLTKNAL